MISFVLMEKSPLTEELAQQTDFALGLPYENSN